eukprot:COSAG06_NODE_338_length_17232_cov_73.406584_11_plen_36_part_00
MKPMGGRVIRKAAIVALSAAPAAIIIGRCCISGLQ